MQKLKTFLFALCFSSVILALGYGFLLAIAAISGRVRPEGLQFIGVVFIVLGVGWSIKMAVEDDS